MPQSSHPIHSTDASNPCPTLIYRLYAMLLQMHTVQDNDEKLFFNKKTYVKNKQRFQQKVDDVDRWLSNICNQRQSRATLTFLLVTSTFTLCGSDWLPSNRRTVLIVIHSELKEAYLLPQLHYNMLPNLFRNVQHNRTNLYAFRKCSTESLHPFAALCGFTSSNYKGKGQCKVNLYRVAQKTAHFLSYALTSLNLTWPIFKLISLSESGEHV